MKRITLLLVAILGVVYASAQEADSLQFQSTAISVDSLSLKLDKLQHDYDYMYCDYNLHKVIMDFKVLSNSISISANDVVTNYHNTRFDSELYTSYLNNYDSDCALFDSLKDNFEVVKIAVLLKMATSDFSEKECNVLNASFNLIQSAARSVEASLNYYKTAIQAYKSKVF